MPIKKKKKVLLEHSLARVYGLSLLSRSLQQRWFIATKPIQPAELTYELSGPFQTQVCRALI